MTVLHSTLLYVHYRALLGRWYKNIHSYVLRNTTQYLQLCTALYCPVHQTVTMQTASPCAGELVIISYAVSYIIPFIIYPTTIVVSTVL